MFGFGCLVFVLLNFSAGMCAGSLASGGCSQSSFSQQKIVVMSDAQNCDLGGLVPAFGHLWDHFGTSGSPWQSAGASGRTCGVMESTCDRFGDDLGTLF